MKRKNEMDCTDSLIKIIRTLLGPNGCPWDQKQTLSSIKGDLLEEACEAIDAIDNNNGDEIKEELGDVLFVVLFLCHLSEKEGFANLNEIVNGVCEKLVRRHPHIFEEKKNLTATEVLIQWDEIKKKEKPIRPPLEKIPYSLPALSRAYETLKVMQKNSWSKPILPIKDPEIAYGHALFSMIEEGVANHIDPELALKKYLTVLKNAIQ